MFSIMLCKDSKKFANGIVYLMETEDGYPIEVTDTFLPYYTKDAVGRKQNKLKDGDLGDRTQRWMIGVSVMSGCPVGCKFCATCQLKKCRNLKAQEIAAQVRFVVANKDNWKYDPAKAQEFKINYTRMGEPFLNIDEVRKAIDVIDNMFPGTTVHHYISTIGIEGADYSWIGKNVTLQFSVHSFDDEYRDWLIPFKRKAKLEDIGQVRTNSKLKTTVNLTMAREEDWSIERMTALFDKDAFFVKVSPINENCVSTANDMGGGIINQLNIV